MSEPGSPDDGMDDEELAELADDLSTVLRELRDELQASRDAEGAPPVEEAPTPGEGAPAPGEGSDELDIGIDLPSATDVLAFTDERLIPAAIFVLEANIRALELLQKGIRWARPDKASENARRVRSRAESVSHSTLQRLDSVLADLQDAAGEGALPDDAEATGIITEARRLRDEIDAALEERAAAREESEEDEADERDEEAGDRRSDPWGLDDEPEVDVDVEGELESIKAELGKSDEEPDDGGDEPADGDAGAGDGAADGDGRDDDASDGDDSADDDANDASDRDASDGDVSADDDADDAPDGDASDVPAGDAGDTTADDADDTSADDADEPADGGGDGGESDA